MKILLPIDGSQHANDAVDFVKSLAQNRDLDVVVLTVSHDPTHYSMRPWLTDLVDQEQRRTESILADASVVLKKVCRKVELVQETGAIVPCVLNNAAAMEADLIVMGATGKSVVKRMLVGSVSDSVATGANCSVVVVRPQPDSGVGPKKIVLGFDQSAASREAVAELTEWNLARDCEVQVVSVALQPNMYVGGGFTEVPITVDPDQVDRMDAAAERMASQIAEQFPRTNAETPVAPHVGEAIVHAAKAAAADLVIVGDTGHSLLGTLLLGSTSKYVLRHAPCSVLISRHHWNSDTSSQEVDDAVATN